MSQGIPVGEREGERLEFKSAQALGRPETIAREVVAMLNAGGGEVWVGLREDDGVAVELEAVEQVEGARHRLHDSLIDTIDPSPTNEEMRIDVVGGDAKVLRILVSGRSGRRPYALLQAGGGRVYVTRVGGRIRHLTHEEIHRPAGEREVRTAQARLEEEMKEVVERAGMPTMWMGIEPTDPVPGLDLDLDRLIEADYLVVPRTTGNRTIGRTFYFLRRRAELDNERFLRREGGRDGSSWLVARGGSYELRIGERAAIRLQAPLDDFTFPGERHPRLDALRGHRILDPRGLLEYPTSVLRLVSALLRDDELWTGERPSTFAVALLLVGVDGWYLRPDPEHPYLDPALPDPRTLRVPPPAWVWKPTAHSGDTLPVPPLSFDAEQLKQEPDECGYRLLRSVFADFGYGEDEIRAFDPVTRRFNFARS